MDARSNKEVEVKRTEWNAGASAQACCVDDGRDSEGQNLDRLNKSQKQLIVIIASHQVGDGYVAFSKRELTELLGKCGKTVDGAVSNLRRRGLIEAKPRYSETGGQISSAYRVTELAREKHPALCGKGASGLGEVVRSMR